MQKAYGSWAVNRFCSPTVNDRLLEPCYAIPANEPRNLGSTIDAWDDRELELGQLAEGLAPPLMVLSQKTWDSPELTRSYAGFLRIMRRIGMAPR